MRILKQKIYHIERPVCHEQTGGYERKNPAYALTWNSLMRIGLCAGEQSDCVRTGTCEAMCAYGRRYLKEKDEHAG